MKRGTSIDSLIGVELNRRPKMIRFYALRMIFELARGKHLTVAEQKTLFNQASKKNMEIIFNES